MTPSTFARMNHANGDCVSGGIIGGVGVCTGVNSILLRQREKERERERETEADEQPRQSKATVFARANPNSPSRSRLLRLALPYVGQREREESRKNFDSRGYCFSRSNAREDAATWRIAFQSFLAMIVSMVEKIIEKSRKLLELAAYRIDFVQRRVLVEVKFSTNSN